MKQAFLTILLLLAALLSASAQELTVKSMELAPLDYSASQYRRLDTQGTPCALVKVRLAVPGAEFSGGIVGKAENKMNEYWVYMAEGIYRLYVKTPNFLPLDIDFRELMGDPHFGVKSLATYKIVITVPENYVLPQTGQVVDDGIRYLTMTVVPKTATVIVDNELCSLTDGQLKLRLQKGSHSYSVMAEGYDTQQGTVTLNETSEHLSITLKSVMAELLVRCATAGAEVYVNGDRKGTVPWRGMLTANNYDVELRMADHRSNRQSITLQKSEQRTLDVPALQPIVGTLDVNYDPLDAEVWLDGKKLGQSPEIFRNILVGRHEVELRKSGYRSKKETVEIQEGQTLSLVGKLVASAVGQTSSASGTDNGHEWVDLGLSVCWATTNVGASKPGDYGDYYAWGETSTKSTYDWSYKYCNGSAITLTKYCTDSEFGIVDNQAVLELSDDVAQVKWGGGWRMPSLEELKELRMNCKWEWTRHDGHKGYRVTGPNGNSIFLPAAGYYFYSSLKGAGSYGNYWSRTLSESEPSNARGLYFYSGRISTYYNYRCNGFSVRPVRLSE